MRTLVVTSEDAEETRRWLQGDRLERLAIAHGLIEEARACGCEAVALHSHTGAMLFAWEHGQSIEESDAKLETMLVPMVPAPVGCSSGVRVGCSHELKRSGYLIAGQWAEGEPCVPLPEPVIAVSRCERCGAFQARSR